MESSEIIKQVTKKMAKAVEHTLADFSSVHTGKASPSMVEGILVEIPSYGSSMKLREIAAVTTPDSRTISIEPWDKGIANDISKAIQKANVGLNPVVAGAVIRCPIPELSRERRQQLVKTTHGMAEEGKVSVRNARREAMDVLKKQQKEGSISEDDLKRLEKEVQAVTDKHVKEIDSYLDQKEKELMQV